MHFNCQKNPKNGIDILIGLILSSLEVMQNSQNIILINSSRTARST